MATLELQFNCLCLFVPDPDNQVVHVLMPATNGHDGHDGHEQHVVRILHPSVKEVEKGKGLDIEGWALTLGPAQGNAETTLTPPKGKPRGGTLPDLSSLTNNQRVASALVGPAPGTAVAARITLRSGGVTSLASEAEWEIEGRKFALAHQVTWTMSDGGAGLQWARLYGPPDINPPLNSLDELEPENDLSYKLRIFHVTDDALPPRGGILQPAVMREHYRALYPLLGITNPASTLLPRMVSSGVVDVNCAGGKAKLE
jgi:hypothetical protein